MRTDELIEILELAKDEPIDYALPKAVINEIIECLKDYGRLLLNESYELEYKKAPCDWGDW